MAVPAAGSATNVRPTTLFAVKGRLDAERASSSEGVFCLEWLDIREGGQWLLEEPNTPQHWPISLQ